MGDTKKRFYSLAVEGREATIDIYGDICSWAVEDWGEVSSWTLSRRIAEMGDVDRINVNINSYGGEVAEGIAIYNALRRHPAQVVTRCDGMACSIASVIFMAGDERVMYAPSMLMIHNASSMAWGTAADLRKAADDNEKITSMSKAAYLERVSIDEERLTELMDAETWIGPDEAVEMGFATTVEAHGEGGEPEQSGRESVFAALMGVQAIRGRFPDAFRAAPAQADDPDDEDDGATPDEPDPDDGGDAGTEPDDADGAGDTGTDGDDDPEDDDDEASQAAPSRTEQAFRSFLMAFDPQQKG